MVVSFIKKQLEGLKSDEEIIHLLKLANPDLTERRINSLMETAKQHADIPILDDKTVTTIRNAAKDGDHTAETMIRALPDASIEKRMHAKNVLYAERNEELFPLINPTILNKTVSRENGKLQVKNVNSVMPNIRIAGSRAEPQSVAMAIKHFEKIRTTRSHRAGGSIGSMNSLNPYLIFAKPVVHPPKWTHSFSDYQQRLQNTQFLASMAAPHHTSQSFKFYKSGGSLPSFASGKWVNPSLQRSAQQSALKLSQMKSVVKLQQLRKQAQAKQEAHAVLQQRISESTQRLMAMRRSTQSRMNAPRPNYDNMFNPMVDLMSRYPSGGMKRAFRTFRSIGSNFSMMDDVSLMNQAFNTTFGPYSGREFSINNHPALIPNIRLETDNKSHRGLTSRVFDENGRQISYANIARNNNNNNNLYSFAGGFGHCSIPPSVRRTHSSQHMLRLISDILAPSIPSNESGRLQIVDKDGVDVEKLLYHGFQVHPRHDDVLIKDFSGSGAIPTPVTSTPPPLTIPTPPPRITIPTTPLRAPPTRSMAALPSNLDADTVRKMLEPYTIGDSRERGFRLVHFKPGNEVDHSILQYIRDVSRIAEQESHDSSLNEMEQTGSSFAFSNVNNILNHLLNNNNKMGKYGMVAALRDDDLELMSALRYSNNREVNPSSTYVNIFGTRGTIRGKGVGSQVFIEAMKHAHDLGVTDFSLCPLSYRQTMKFYRRHGMDRSNHFDLARHVPRLLKEQEEFRGVSIDRQLAGIHGNSIRPESIMSGINRTVLETLKTRFSHAQGGSIPSFMDGGNPFDAIRENSIDRVRSLKMNYGMDKEKALRYYKGTYYDAINRFLETGDMNVSYGNKVLKNIQLKGAVPYLDQATSEHTAPSDVLHKGLSEYWMSFLQDKNVGDTVTFPGFLSTTTDMKTAMKHARSGLADIHVNKDTKGYQYLNDIEPEFLMQRGQSFKIQDILTSNNKSHYVLKHLMEQKALGGLIPSFESGGPQSIYNMNDASMLTSLLSPDQVDHSAKVMAHASHIWSMMNGSDKGHNILQNAASLHDIGKTIDPKAHGKLAGKFGSLLGIDKISKFLINNHSGTRQPSLKEFKKLQRSEVRKMLGALRLADVSARTGTLPLSMKKGSLKLGNTRELDINKHQLQRIKSSLKMINRMNGGSIPSFMGGGNPRKDIRHLSGQLKNFRNIIYSSSSEHDPFTQEYIGKNSINRMSKILNKNFPSVLYKFLDIKPLNIHREGLYPSAWNSGNRYDPDTDNIVLEKDKMFNPAYLVHEVIHGRAHKNIIQSMKDRGLGPQDFIDEMGGKEFLSDYGKEFDIENVDGIEIDKSSRFGKVFEKHFGTLNNGLGHAFSENTATVFEQYNKDPEKWIHNLLNKNTPSLNNRGFNNRESILKNLHAYNKILDLGIKNIPTRALGGDIFTQSLAQGPNAQITDNAVKRLQLLRIKSSLKMINRMNGGSIPSFMDGGWTGLLKYAHLTKTPESASRLISRNSVNSLQSMAENTGLHGLLSSMIKSGSPDSAFKGLFYRKGLDANTWMEKVHQMKLQQASTFMNGYFAQGGNVPRFDGGGDPWEDIKHLLNPKARCFPTNDHSIYRNKLATSACTNHVKLEDWDNYIWRRFNPDSLKFEDIQMLPGNEYDFIDKNGIPLMERLYDQYSLSTNPAHVSAIQRLNNIDLNKLFEYHNEDVDLFSLRPMNMVKDIIDNNFIKNEHAMSARYDVGALNLIDIDKRSNDKYGKSLRMLEKHMFSSDPNRQLIFKKHLDRANSLIHNLKFTDEEWEGMTDDYSPGARLLDSVKSKIFNLSDNRSLFDNTPYADLDKFKATMSTTLSDKYNTEPTGMFTKGMNNLSGQLMEQVNKYPDVENDIAWKEFKNSIINDDGKWLTKPLTGEYFYDLFKDKKNLIAPSYLGKPTMELLSNLRGDLYNSEEYNKMPIEDISRDNQFWDKYINEYSDLIDFNKLKGMILHRGMVDKSYPGNLLEEIKSGFINPDPAYQFMSGHQSISDVFANQGAMGWDEYPGNSVMLKHIIDDNDRNRLGFLGTDEFEFILGRNAGWNVDEDLGNNVFKVSPFFGTRGEWAFSKFAKGIPTRALGGSIPGYAVGALGHGVIQNVRRNKFFERFGSGDLTHDGTGRLQKLLNLKQFQSQQNDAYGNVINQNPFMDANIGRLSGKLNKVTLWDKIKRGLGRANGGYLQQFNDGGNPFTLDDIETSSKFKDAYLIQKGSPDEHFSDRNSRYRQYFKDNPDLFDLTNRIYEFGGQDLFQAFALSSLSEDNGLMQQLLLSNKTRSDQVTGWLKERGLLYTMSMDPKRGPKFSNHKNLWDALVDYHKIPMDQREGTAKELLQNYLKQITGRRSINWNTVGLSRRAQGGSGGIPALVSAKEAYLPPKMAGSLGSRRLDTLRSMADDNTLMDDIPELHKLFGGVPSINGAGVFAGGSGNPTADDIFTHLEPGSYILDYQTLEAMRKLDPRSVKFGGAISGMPIRRATGGVIGFAAGGFGDRVRAFASNFYNEFKYPYQAEQTRVGSSARLQTAGYGTFDNAGIFKPDLGVDAQNQAVIDKYQAELEDWAVNTFKHLTPEDAKKRVSAKIQEQTRNVVKGSGTKAVNVEETFKTLKPEVMFDSKDLEKIGKSSEDLVESFKNMTDNAFRDPNNSKKFFKTLNLGLVETEKHVQNVALEFTTLGKFSSHMKDFSFRLASVSMAAMGVNFSTMAVFQSITSGISQITAPFSDLESLMQNTGYLKAFGDAANVPVEAIQSLTGNTDGLVDTWKKIGGMTAYLQLSFASLGEALFKNDDMMEAFADGMEEVFVALKDPQTIRSMADLFTSMSQSLPVLADVVKGVAAALKLVADQPMIMQIMMYSTIFSMLLQPLFSLGSALLTFIGIGAGFINWSRGAVLAIKSLDIAFLGLNTTLVASLAYLALVALAIEGVARVYELLTGSEVTFKPSNIIMGALGFASDGDDYVEGAGTTTSDEIPYMLSRGERVVNATDNAAHYADYEALENNTIPPFFKRGAATGEDYVGGSPNLTDYRYYEGIKSVTSIDTMKADQDTADTLTAARDGNAIRVIVKNANEIGGRHEEQQNEIQAPFAGGTPQLERIINPAPGLKIFDILGKFKPDLKLDWKPDFKFDLGKLDFKFDLGKIIADLFKKGGEIKPDEKIDTKSEPKSTLDWYKSFIDQIKSARGSASDDDWKPNERYFNTEDLKPPKSSKTKGGIFDTFKKFIPDSLKGFAAPEFARGDITKGNVLKSIIADKGPLKTGTGMLGYANPLDIFSVLNILNAGRFGTGATVAETVNQTIGGAVTGLGVAGSLVGGGIVKAAGFSKIGTAIALPGQVLSKAALPLAAATPFLIGAEGAMANRRFLAGESIEDIKNTPFDELSSAEKFATVLTGGIGTSATANGLKVLVGMHGEEAARQSLIATQTGIDSIANWIPGLNILNRGLGAVGGPSIGEVGVGGAMALVGLPESISDFAHAVAGLPAWFASLSEPEDQGDQAGGSIAQTYDEMNKRIDTSGMQYVGKNNDEVVEWMNQQIAAQQQTQPNNISFTINAQPDVADQVYGIVDNALRSNGFYDGQRV